MALMPFAGQFTKASGSQQIPAGGLTVTFTLVQVALSGGAMTTLVNAGTATEVTTNTPGTYFYVYSGTLDFTSYFYVGAFKTADATVQQVDVASAWFDFPTSIAKDAGGRVDVGKVAGTAQTARDLGANLDAAVSSRSTFAGGAVASVTGNVGGNVAGSVGSVTAGVTLADGAITEAKVATPAEAAGRPAGLLGMMRRVFEWAANRRTRDRSTGAVLLRDAADAATLETQTQATAGTVDSQSKGV